MEAQLHHTHGQETVNETPAVRNGLVQPTDMGTPVLVEDLYATHSDIVDPPVRSFAQWEEEESHGAPPPLSTGYVTDLSHLDQYGYGQGLNREELRAGIERTGMEEDFSSPNLTAADSPANHEAKITDTTKSGGEEARMTEVPMSPPPPLSTGSYGTNISEVGHHGAGEDVNGEELRGAIGRTTGMEEDPSAPNLTTVASPANYESKVTDPTKTGGNEVGITNVLRSFDKMGIHEEPHSKFSDSDQNEPTGSHDQFAPEPIENPPPDTFAGDSSRQSSHPTGKTTSTSAIAEKAGKQGENNTKSSLAMDYAHKVADRVTGTLGPAYEKVVGTGSTVMSKMQWSGHEEKTGSPTRSSPESKGVSVKEYLVGSFKPGEEDKELSEVITNVFYRRKANAPPPQESCSDVRDEGERRLQESGN